jgi:hypothetical protein
MSFHFGDKVHRLDVTKALLVEGRGRREILIYNLQGARFHPAQAVDQMMDLLARVRT